MAGTVVEVEVRTPAGGVRCVAARGGEAVGAVVARALGLPPGGGGAGPGLRCRAGGRGVGLGEAVGRALGGRAGGAVEVCAGLRGGGGDGGSTGAEDRRAYLEMYAQKKADKVDPKEVRRAKWTQCQLSGEPLEQPCVADLLGNLYNKEAVIKRLLGKSMPPEFAHIRSLKRDLVELRLTANPEAGRASDKSKISEGYVDLVSGFSCPITGLEMNGRSRFLADRAGHVVSERALKEAKPLVEEHVGGPLDPAAFFPLNGTPEEVKGLRAALPQRKKKKKKAAAAGAGPAGKRKGSDVLANDAAVPEGKKFKASQHVPAGATKEVYASIFTSSKQGEEKETFMCRSTGAMGGRVGY